MMKASNRIIVNTLVQYLRTIINMVLTLYSSRLVLSVLGVEDYGVYSLVAGVVSLLSFLTNSLVGSTQRFLSVSQGKGDINRLKEVFNNSILLHIFLGLIVAFILGILTPFVFNDFVNIPEGRVYAAKLLYILVILMVYISFIASPYRALLVSHENIIYISIIDIIDGVLKVILVWFLPFIHFDKLFAYGLILLGIQLFNLFAFIIYSSINYKECIFPRLSLFGLPYIKELFSFSSWILYSSVCITFRVQGIAIVLNRTFGATINAAYGIGTQISGMISFISSSFTNAISPQLMAAEGAGNRSKMLTLAELQSKMSFLLLAMIGIPTMFEMSELLSLWLIKVPENTTVFACMFLLMQILDMWSSGLGLANKAIGDIGKYTLITSTPKLLSLPLVWFVLVNGLSLRVVAYVMISIEFLCMFLRIYLFRKQNWFNISNYLNNVIVRTIPPVIISIIACSCVNIFISGRVSFVLSYIVSIPLFLLTSYFIALNISEKSFIDRLLKKFIIRG